LYGGWKALCLSPYAQLSLFLGVLCEISADEKFDASSLTTSIVPNVLGFTVGALAIILAFSSSRFFSFLTEEGQEKSLFMKTVSNFVHFIIVQVLSLIVALVAVSHSNWFSKLISAIILFYAILTTLSTVIQLFQMATVFNASNQNVFDDDIKNESIDV